MDFEKVFKVVDAAVFAKTQRHLKDVERFVFWGACQSQTYEEMAKTSDYRYTPSYLKQDVGPKLWKLLSVALGEEVSKTNFRAAVERRTQLIQVQKPQQAKALDVAGDTVQERQDWGEAVNVSVFYGRNAELATLEQWVVQDHCRLVALFGMGGIGKTALAVRCAEQIQHEFDFLIWRSLLHAPPVEEFLAELIQFLSHEQQPDLPQGVDSRIELLIDYLHDSRCLLVLDNSESILDSVDGSGQYREGYVGYGSLLKRVGEAQHQSCLLLCSRDKPPEIASLEGITLSVRSLQLSGLQVVEGIKLLKVLGFSGAEDKSRELIEHYHGNPLALKIIATTISELFAGNFDDFWSQNIADVGEISELLDQHFEQFSALEKQIMYWLAINREPVSVSKLQEDILPLISKQKLIEALKSLERRTLLEKNSVKFTQQPVVMEYMIERLIEQVCEEITTEKLTLLMSHALIKAEAKDYIRASQMRVILEPIADRLRTTFRAKKHVEHKLNRIFLKLRGAFSASPGYAGGNLLNLLRQLKINLTSYDFSELTVW